MSYYVVTLSFVGKADSDLGTAQREFLNRLTAEGQLILSGPFKDEIGGGMAILAASSADEAKSLYQKSPLAQSGLIKWTIREWDARNGIALGRDKP